MKTKILIHNPSRVSAGWLIGFVACLLVVLAAGSVYAKDKPGETSGEKPELFGEFGAMARELKLDAETQSKLADVAKDREEALSKWDKENSSKLAVIKRASTDAHEAGNNAEAKTQMEAAGKLQGERKAIEAKFDKMGFDVLTPDQQTQWLASKLVKQLLKSYKSIVFTEDQKKVIMSRATVMIQGQKDARDEKVWASMLSDLRDSVDKDVLTPEQTAQLLKVLDVAKGSDRHQQ